MVVSFPCVGRVAPPGCTLAVAASGSHCESFKCFLYGFMGFLQGTVVFVIAPCVKERFFCVSQKIEDVLVAHVITSKIVIQILNFCGVCAILGVFLNYSYIIILIVGFVKLYFRIFSYNWEIILGGVSNAVC